MVESKVHNHGRRREGRGDEGYARWRPPAVFCRPGRMVNRRVCSADFQRFHVGGGDNDGLGEGVQGSSGNSVQPAYTLRHTLVREMLRVLLMWKKSSHEHYSKRFCHTLVLLI